MADWHWRNTARPPRFFTLDARAAFPFLLLLLHMRLWTLGLAAAVTASLYLMERRGLTYEAGMRAFRAFIVGRHRWATVAGLRRRLVDKGV